MKATALATVVVSLVLAHAQAQAVDGATAPYNEAVQIINGKRVVEVAPFPAHMQLAVNSFKRPDENPALTPILNEVETPQGLMDCAHTPWYHPKACSPTTFGKEKRLRQWTVKMHGKWFSCNGQAKPTQCIPLIADGKLRALGTPPLE
jgi:hypothetical protein